MSLKQSVTLVLMALVLSACASTSNEEEHAPRESES